MAKRVLQADGTYCYTDNCRVHDRSGLPAVGAASLVADAGRATRTEVTGLIQQALTEHKSLYKTKKSLTEASEQITDTLYNANNMSPFAIANMTRVALAGTDKGFNDTYDWDRMVELSSHILDGAKAAHRIERGTRVVISATGETGTVSETHNPLSPRPFRVHTDSASSTNDFKFFSRSEIVKLNEPSSDAPAREQVAYAAPDATLKTSLVSALLREESDPERYNAQGLRGVTGGEYGLLSLRDELQQVAHKWDSAHDGLSSARVTKGKISRFLRDEHRAARPWLNTEERENVRDAIANILAYTDAGAKVQRLTQPVAVA